MIETVPVYGGSRFCAGIISWRVEGLNMHIIVIAVLYLLLSLVIGLLGRNRKFGFWGYFFGSIVLTPIIGLILIFASDSRKPDKALK